VHGNTTGLTVRGYLHGQMAGYTKAITRMTKNMGLVSFSGKMVKSRSVIGKMVNNTVTGSCRKTINK